MFWAFNKYLIDENKGLKERINHLESRLDEVLDAKLFNRVPERLIKEVENKDKTDSISASTIPSDALSVAEEDAWKRSKSKND